MPKADAKNLMSKPEKTERSVKAMKNKYSSKNN